MLAVIAALVPVFLLIATGFALRRWLIQQDAHWIGLERILYYAMFPALLVESLSRADLSKVPVLAVGRRTACGRVDHERALSRATALAGAPPWRWWTCIHLAVSGRDALADLRGTGGRGKPVRRSGSRARVGRHGGDDSRTQPARRVGARAL